MPRGLRLNEGSLAPEIVYDLAQILQLSDHAFIVGGQALNLWAERYSHVGELAAYGPYTSKDIDYFGYREAAQKLATALNGTLSIPQGDDHTPQTAIVRAKIGDQEIEIDFLHHVKGVQAPNLEKQAVEMILTVRTSAHRGDLRIPIMHPLHCMQSRLANVVDLNRTQDLALRQLEASPIVLREYLSEMLDAQAHKHVTGVLQVLHDYLLTDPTGRKAHRVMKNDPARIFDHFKDDERLDERWRRHSLSSMRSKIEDRRTAWGEFKATIARAVSRKGPAPQ